MTYRILTSQGLVKPQRVTEVIRRGLPAPQLEEWKLRSLADFSTVHSQYRAPNELLVAWRKDSMKAAERGTRVHRIIAESFSGVSLPVAEDEQGYIGAMLTWVKDHYRDLPEDNFTWKVEQALVNEDRTVAGTADLVADSLLIDWKTSERPRSMYPSELAQIGAYASMRTTVSAPDKVGRRRITGRAPQITEGRIVVLCPDGRYQESVVAGENLDEAKELWRHVRAVAGWVK